MPDPIPFPPSDSELNDISRDIENYQMGNEPKSVYEALILGLKMVGMQLHPEAINIDRQLIHDASEIAGVFTGDPLPLLYDSLLTAMVLYRRATNAGQL